MRGDRFDTVFGEINLLACRILQGGVKTATASQTVPNIIQSRVVTRL